MTEIRKIRKIVTGSNQIDGAGVKLVRVIGHADVQEFDPFLMLDAFDSKNPADYTKGFPWHLYVQLSKGGRFLLFLGRPLHEPIAWGGPTVMNTQEELQEAFREIDNGTFIKNNKKI